MQSTVRRSTAIVAMLLALVTVAASASFATKGFIYDQAYGHDGSPAYADNGADYSLVRFKDEGRPGDRGPDRLLYACDVTRNGEKSAARGFNNGRIVVEIEDGNGADRGCASRDTNQNLSGHDACSRSNPVSFCGPDSRHGD